MVESNRPTAPVKSSLTSRSTNSVPEEMKSREDESAAKAMVTKITAVPTTIAAIVFVHVIIFSAPLVMINSKQRNRF